MRAQGDEMANSGKPIDNDKLVSYILTGLEDEYNPTVMAPVARANPVSV